MNSLHNKQDKISLAITTYNRYEQTIECFINIVSDERVGEVIIVDDASEIGYYLKLKEICDHFKKIKLYRNEVNLDCYKNKIHAISLCTNDYVAILDSDNIFDKDYIDALYSVEWDSKTIYAPIWAMPTFDYREFTNETITKENVASFMDKKMFSTALNTSNYFFNKNEFLSTIDTTKDPITAEAIFTNYNWLKKGNKIHFLEGLQYQHTIHQGSHYKNNVHRTGNFYNEIENNLRNMK